MRIERIISLSRARFNSNGLSCEGLYQTFAPETDIADGIKVTVPVYIVDNYFIDRPMEASLYEVAGVLGNKIASEALIIGITGCSLRKKFYPSPLKPLLVAVKTLLKLGFKWAAV